MVFRLTGDDTQIYLTKDTYGKYPRLFDVGPARAHLEGSVDSVSCPVCAFDERNRALHGYIQESLF